MPTRYELFESDEILERYFQPHHSRRVDLPADAQLDKIDKSLTGRAIAPLLRQATIRQKMGSDIRLCARFLCGELTPGTREPPRSRRPFTSDFMKDRMGELVGVDMLQRVKKSSMPRGANCGLFAVEKAGKRDEHGRQLARVIFDARAANDHLEPLSATLLLFTLAQLIGAMYLFGTGSAYLVDMRHYYYQWKLPLALARFFIIAGSEKDWVYIPLVLAMGYRDACVVAQAASWVIVFRRPTFQRCTAKEPTVHFSDDELKARRRRYQQHLNPHGPDLEICGSVTMREVMPPFVWLRAKDGRRVGAIFVLLDGILVLTDSANRELRDAWRLRIEQNLYELDIVVKAAETAAATGHEPRQLTFAGVEVRFGAKPGVRPVKRDCLAPHSVLTHRDGATLAGELIWILRVRNAPASDFNVVLNFARRVGLFQAGHETGELVEKPAASWDAPIEGIDHELRETLQCICRRYLTESFEPPRPWLSEEPEITLFAVTDANLQKRAFIILRDLSSDPLPEAIVTECAFEIEGETMQVWAEGCAVSDLLRHVESVFPGRRVRLYLVVDADPVRVALTKGYSSSSHLTDLVTHRESCRLIDLHVGRVPGLMNLADLPSRNQNARRMLAANDSDAIYRYTRTVAALRALVEAQK